MFTFTEGPVAECSVGDMAKVLRTGETGTVVKTGRGVTGKPILKMQLKTGKDAGKIIELNPKQVEVFRVKQPEIREVDKRKAPVVKLVETPKQSKMEELFTADLFDTEEAVAEHVEKKARRDRLARLIKACYALDDATTEVAEGEYIEIHMADWNKFVEAVEKIDTA